MEGLVGQEPAVSRADGELVQSVAEAETTSLVTRTVGAANVFVEIHARITAIAPNSLANLGIITRLSGSSGAMCDVLTDAGFTQDFAMHDVTNNGAGFAAVQVSFTRVSDGTPFILRTRTEGSVQTCSGASGGREFGGGSRVIVQSGTDVALRFKRLAARIRRRHLRAGVTALESRHAPPRRTLIAWLDHRRREKWLLGGVVVVAGAVAIVGAALIAASGAIDADGVLLPAIMLGILLVAFVPTAQLNRLWQRRRYQLDEDTLLALDLAFSRAILQKRDPRRAAPDEAVAILKAALDETTGATLTPTFSDAQLRAAFTVQRSLRRAIMAPGLALAAMSFSNAFIDDTQTAGVVSGVGLLVVVVSAFIGHLLHRRVRAASGLSDHELGTLRAAAMRAGLVNAAGSDDDVHQLRAALRRS